MSPSSSTGRRDCLLFLQLDTKVHIYEPISEKTNKQTQLLHLEITLHTASVICAITSIPETDRMRDQYIDVSQHSTLENRFAGRMLSE